MLGAIGTDEELRAPALGSRSPRTWAGVAKAARKVFVGTSSDRRLCVALNEAGSVLAGVGLDVFLINGLMSTPLPMVTWSSPPISPELLITHPAAVPAGSLVFSVNDPNGVVIACEVAIGVGIPANISFTRTPSHSEPLPPPTAAKVCRNFAP